MMSLLGAAAVLSACGDGESGTEVPPRIREATALLARSDLSELTEAEEDLVESALREALGWAETVRVRSILDEQDLAFGSDGRVAMMRRFGTAERGPPEFATPEVSRSETIRVYVGSPAQFCDGSEGPELAMVQEYKFAFDEWQVSARAIPPDQMPFDLLFSRLDLSVAEDAGFSEDRGRQLRGLSVPFPQQGDPEATATVWVDLEEGLIRRLETTLPGAPGSSYLFTFEYDVPIEIEIPSEPAAPDCIPVESGG